MAAREITWTGVLLRFLFAAALVLATYNPEGYSYLDWVTTPETGPLALKVLAGVVLVIGWTVFLRATFASLGGLGILLTIALFGSALWVLTSFGLLAADSLYAVTYMVLFVIAALLTVGMSWSHIRRRLSGQFDVDEIEQD